MKKYLVCFVLLLVSAVAVADDSECEAAVDAANRINPNEKNNCDYSNTGLNGVLHRAFAKKSESSSSEKADVAETPKAADVKEQVSVETINKAVTSPEFSSPQQLQILRYALIKKAQAECSKGFLVDGERYVPTSSVNKLKLELVYHCL